MPKVRSKGFSNPAQTWDTRFSTDSYIFGTEPNVWLSQHGHLLQPGSRVLAVADGSPIGVGKAIKLARQADVEVNFQVASAEDFDWKVGEYDAVVAIFIQFADPDTRTTLFKRMTSALKPDGLMLLQGYTPKQLEYKTGGPPLVDHLYTEELLRESFSDMNIVELVSYEDVLREGTQHSGQSALIGLVARKTSGGERQ
ncbi:MAG: class I SAM-dependent methyltransferase [Oxalobacteraceae bacterium]|nr:class I SAM-dependent methyltransferase [Oxalobacteraceae bacterium]